MKLKGFETKLEEWRVKKNEDRNKLSADEKELLRPGLQYDVCV